MQLKVSPQAAVLYLDGVVHRESSDAIEAAFEKALGTGAPCIIVSFQEVKAMLSDGIRLMIALCDKTRHAKKDFHITDLPKEVRYSLQITNLLNLLGHAGFTINLLQDKQIDPKHLEEVELPATAQTATPAKAPQGQEKPATKAAAPATKSPAAAPATSHAPHRELNDQEMWTLIHSHVPGRNEFRIAEYMARRGVNVKNLDNLVTALRSDKEAVTSAVKRLISRGTIHPVGGGLFNFSGSEELRSDLTYLATCLQNSQKHGKILKLLMDAERH